MHGLKCIFFYVPLSPSGVLQLVETLEGDVLVLRDGQPFGGYRWSGEQIADAVDAFRRIAANLQRESWPGELFTDRPYSAPPREQTDRANVHATR